MLTYNIGTDQVSTYKTVKLSNLRWLVDFVHADVAGFQECSYSEEELKVVSSLGGVFKRTPKPQSSV